MSESCIEEQIARLEEKTNILFRDGKRTEELLQLLTLEIKSMRYEFAHRVPVWVTIVIAILTTLVGGLVAKGWF